MEGPEPSIHMTAMPSLFHTETSAADITRKFVRVTERRDDGFVAFEFSIGWPELAVELLLPAPAFEEFCDANHVKRLEG